MNESIIPYMSLHEITSHVFNNSQIDKMKNFSPYARVLLILGKINEEEYIEIESILSKIKVANHFLSDDANKCLRLSLKEIDSIF